MPRKETTKKTTTKRASTTRKRTTTSTGGNTKKMTLVNPAEVEGKIREKAYELYLQRGATHGADFDDWLKAERQIKRELSHV